MLACGMLKLDVTYSASEWPMQASGQLEHHLIRELMTLYFDNHTIL